MKVKVENVVEVSDEQRVAVAQLLDGRQDGRRQATREELKDFIWRHGSDWAKLVDRAGEFNAELAELI